MKIGYIFPGYGSQFVGMAKELYDEYRIVQEYFEEASNCLNQNFVKLVFASSEAELSSLLAAHTSLFLVGCSIARVLQEHGIVPNTCAGFVQGDYAALCSAGAFTFPDGLYLIQKSASFYEAMFVQQDIQALRLYNVDTLHKKYFNRHVALYDLDNISVAVGSPDQIALLAQDNEVQDKKIEYIAREYALTHPLFNEVIDQFKMYLEKVDFKDIHYPFIRGYDGQYILYADEIKEYMLDRMRFPVHWPLVAQRLADYDIIIQIGPGKQILDSLQKVYPEKVFISVNSPEDIEYIKEHVLGDSLIK